jgi:hypothetical protein
MKTNSAMHWSEAVRFRITSNKEYRQDNQKEAPATTIHVSPLSRSLQSTPLTGGADSCTAGQEV